MYLIKKYGEYTNHTICFKLKHHLSEIEGCSFNIQGNKIFYKLRGQYSKKYQNFNFQEPIF